MSSPGAGLRPMMSNMMPVIRPVSAEIGSGSLPAREILQERTAIVAFGPGLGANVRTGCEMTDQAVVHLAFGARGAMSGGDS